jgi:hypothetical protein
MNSVLGRRHPGRSRGTMFLLLMPAYVALGGCSERIPESETAVITRCERPDTIDTDVVAEFDIKFDGVDPRGDVPTVAFESTVSITGKLALNPHSWQRGDTINLVVGLRPVVNGKADWSMSPCDLPGRPEWSLTLKHRKEGEFLVGYLDRQRAVDRDPGDYELRFYGIKENSGTDDLPTVYHIGRGRLRVVARDVELHVR